MLKLTDLLKEDYESDLRQATLDYLMDAYAEEFISCYKRLVHPPFYFTIGRIAYYNKPKILFATADEPGSIDLRISRYFHPLEGIAHYTSMPSNIYDFVTNLWYQVVEVPPIFGDHTYLKIVLYVPFVERIKPYLEKV